MKDLTNEQLLSTYKGCQDALDSVIDIDNSYHRGSINIIVNTCRALMSNVSSEYESRTGEEITDFI